MVGLLLITMAGPLLHYNGQAVITLQWPGRYYITMVRLFIILQWPGCLLYCID